MFELHLILVLASLFTVEASEIIGEKNTTEIVLEWNYINFTWPSRESYAYAISDGSYVVENNALSSIKVWKNEVYLSLPRWKSGVPVTLAFISVYDLSPLLEPFPDWQTQMLGDCSAFQSVMGMEIDPMGKMWIIDTGRSDLMTDEPKSHCPPKLMVLDLEDNNKVLMTYEFPEDVAHSQTVLLTDIVLDHTDGGWAYITDTDSEDPGIIVFSLQARESWKVKHDTMQPEEIAFDLIVGGVKMVNKSPVNGIALSPINEKGVERWVYYTSISSFEVHSIPTSFMKSREHDANEVVRSHGRKSSQSVGMGMSTSGILYFGLLADDAIGFWDTVLSPDKVDEQVLIQDYQTMQWANSFTFDFLGRLWYITTRAHRFRANSIEVDEVNYRVVVADTISKGYQYYENDTIPLLPDIN